MPGPPRPRMQKGRSEVATDNATSGLFRMLRILTAWVSAITMPCRRPRGTRPGLREAFPPHVPSLNDQFEARPKGPNLVLRKHGHSGRLLLQVRRPNIAQHVTTLLALLPALVLAHACGAATPTHSPAPASTPTPTSLPTATPSPLVSLPQDEAPTTSLLNGGTSTGCSPTERATNTATTSSPLKAKAPPTPSPT